MFAAPRQERAQRTRADLLQATEALVAAEGAAAVTTTRVAAMTGVAVGTIYRYFPDSGALLLAAYDATVARIVAACAGRLATLEPDLPPDRATLLLIDAYLTAAEAIPAHGPLLAEMRRRRPVGEDHEAEHVASQILLPLLSRYGMAGAADMPGRLAAVYAMLSALVDLYLVADSAEARTNIRAELEAHAQFALSRLKPGDISTQGGSGTGV